MPGLLPFRSPGRRTCVLVVVGVVAALVTSCSSASTSAGNAFEPVTADTLTVATAYIPAPSFWMPDDGAYAGFEAGIADALAAELGVSEVEVVQVPFDDIVGGDLGDADLAISTLTPTAEREEILDFTVPYIEAPPGVLVRKGVEASDAQDLRQLQWAVVDVSTLTEVVRERIRPDADPLEVADRTAELKALRAGDADAVLLDLPVAQGIAEANPELYDVVGQLSGGEGLAVALAGGSANRDVVDSAVRALRSDGTIDDLAEEWLGGTGDDVPLIRVAR